MRNLGRRFRSWIKPVRARGRQHLAHLNFPIQSSPSCLISGLSRRQLTASNPMLTRLLRAKIHGNGITRRHAAARLHDECLRGPRPKQPASLLELPACAVAAALVLRLQVGGKEEGYQQRLARTSQHVAGQSTAGSSTAARRPTGLRAHHVCKRHQGNVAAVKRRVRSSAHGAGGPEESIKVEHCMGATGKLHARVSRGVAALDVLCPEMMFKQWHREVYPQDAG